LAYFLHGQQAVLSSWCGAASDTTSSVFSSAAGCVACSERGWRELRRPVSRAARCYRYSQVRGDPSITDFWVVSAGSPHIWFYLLIFGFICYIICISTVFEPFERSVYS